MCHVYFPGKSVRIGNVQPRRRRRRAFYGECEFFIHLNILCAHFKYILGPIFLLFPPPPQQKTSVKVALSKLENGRSDEGKSGHIFRLE